MAESDWGFTPPTTEDATGGFGAGDASVEPAEAAEAAPTLTKEEYAHKAKEHGWTERNDFDYELFNRDGGDWHGAAKVYEWSDEYGEVAPGVPALEYMLFGGEFQMRKGEHFNNIGSINVEVEGPEKFEPVRSFENAGLHPAVLENVKLARYFQPTPIQEYTLPAVRSGEDVVAISQTGSGKTAAYLIPIVSKLMGKAKKLAAPRPDVTRAGYDPRIHRVKAEPLVVIVVPTRELAIQVFDEARRMCYRSMLRPCVCYGGLPMKLTIEELGKGCDVLIATPGRLCDMMDKPHILSMNRVKFTVIDEADEMLHNDWEDELTKIMSGGDTNEDADHQYMMFSATFPKEARQLARQYMSKDHYRIRVGRIGSAHKNIRQEVIQVDHDMKQQALYDLLMELEPGRTIVFCNSVFTVESVDDFLFNRHMPTTSIHSKRNQREREDALRSFRTGRAPILVASGVSARGWDIADVKHIINYDLPSTQHGGITEYTHRIGRTARMGNQGLATSFYTERDEDLAQALVNVLVENDCPVPDFLSHLAPEDKANIDFEDDSEEEGEAEQTDGGNTGGVTLAGGAWGGAGGGGSDDNGAPIADAPASAVGWGGGAPAEAPAAAAGWGDGASKAVDDGW